MINKNNSECNDQKLMLTTVIDENTEVDLSCCSIEIKKFMNEMIDNIICRNKNFIYKKNS